MIQAFIIAPFWWFIIPGLALGLYAQVRLRSTYGRYSKVAGANGLTGAGAARVILDSAGLVDVPVREVRGLLSDHYDPTKRVLFLSSSNYHGCSLAALGVAAHEAGHAIQHKEAYTPLQLRMVMVPITQFASNAVMWIIILGIFFGMAQLLWLGVIVFAIITVFQAITLPVEYNASSRAKARLQSLGIINSTENRAIKSVLNAAALTYVAGLVQALSSFMQFFLLAQGADE